MDLCWRGTCPHPDEKPQMTSPFGQFPHDRVALGKLETVHLLVKTRSHSKQSPFQQNSQPATLSINRCSIQNTNAAMMQQCMGGGGGGVVCFKQKLRISVELSPYFVPAMRVPCRIGDWQVARWDQPLQEPARNTALPFPVALVPATLLPSTAFNVNQVPQSHGL